MLAFALAFALASPAPVSPGVYFVVATSALVRRAPEGSAAVVTDAGIGTALQVTELTKAASAGWAKVVVGPRTFRFDAVDAEAVPMAPLAFDARMPTGWVRVEDIAPAAPSRVALLADARAATDQGARGALLLRAWALDPFDEAVASQASVTSAATAAQARGRRRASTRSGLDRADLLFGCRGDIARASLIGGSVASLGVARPPSTAPNVCVAGLDVRPPCDPAGAAAHRAALARLVPRFGTDGPALRLVAGPGTGDRPLWVVMRLLAVDGCSDCVPTAASTDVRVARLRVPRVEQGLTVLHVLVPRAQGVVYDIVTADSRDDLSDDALSFQLGDAFDADPRDEPGPGEHLFAAPDVCSCVCDHDDDDAVDPFDPVGDER